MTGDWCVCGHSKTDHIYEVAACRPGYMCYSGCTNFVSNDQFTIDDALTELGRVIPSRGTDPDTSHAAAAEIKIRANSQRALLLDAFYRKWNHDGGGLTDDQAMHWAAGVYQHSCYWKRCSELREGGYIEPTGETRPGSAGPQRIVSRITAKGRAWIESNRA